MEEDTFSLLRFPRIRIFNFALPLFFLFPPLSSPPAVFQLLAVLTQRLFLSGNSASGLRGK